MLAQFICLFLLCVCRPTAKLSNQLFNPGHLEKEQSSSNAESAMDSFI